MTFVVSYATLPNETRTPLPGLPRAVSLPPTTSTTPLHPGVGCGVTDDERCGFDQPGTGPGTDEGVVTIKGQKSPDTVPDLQGITHCVGSLYGFGRSERSCVRKAQGHSHSV